MSLRKKSKGKKVNLGAVKPLINQQYVVSHHLLIVILYDSHKLKRRINIHYKINQLMVKEGKEAHNETMKASKKAIKINGYPNKGNTLR